MSMLLPDCGQNRSALLGRPGASVSEHHSPSNVYWVDLAKPVDPGELGLLSSAETRLANRYTHAARRRAYVSCRIALRNLVSYRLEVDPREVTFAHTSTGKPFVRSPRADGFHFNLSHSRGLGAIAISEAGPVGIDVEADRELSPSFLKYGNRYLDIPEETERAAFLREWVRFEAQVKATGGGLAAARHDLPDMVVEDLHPQRVGYLAALARIPLNFFKRTQCR